MANKNIKTSLYDITVIEIPNPIIPFILNLKFPSSVKSEDDQYQPK